MTEHLIGLALSLALIIGPGATSVPGPSHVPAVASSTAHPHWDEAEQAWRDPASLKVWWLPSPGWVEADGQGHYWWDGGWRWRDGTPWRDLSVPVYAASGGVEQWRPLVAAHFPSWVVDYALSVMHCESKGQYWVTSYAGAIGLFQMMPFHSWRVGYRDLYDPAANVEAAAHLWREQGWQPWIACL